MARFDFDLVVLLCNISAVPLCWKSDHLAPRGLARARALALTIFEMYRNAAQQVVKRARVASPTSWTGKHTRPISFFSSAPPPQPSPMEAVAAAPQQSQPADKHKSTTNTISEAEIAHFTALAQHWWDPTGEFALLHRMNPARIEFMRDSLMRHEELPNEGRNGNWLRGKDVLDVGCGGGIFAEVSSLSGMRGQCGPGLTEIRLI